MKLKSSAFNNKGKIPSIYTCDGKNISPPLEWENPPEYTRSFVLILDDPDALLGTWNHWIIYNIPSYIRKLEENIQTLPIPAKLGQNSWHKENYSGPCPPNGEHRYYFKLYALNESIESPDKVSRVNIEQLITPCIISEASLIGYYSSKKRG